MASTAKTGAEPPIAIDRTLRAQARDAIRAAILDGRLGHGAKLVERDLCALTGASRSILREALVHLEVSGLIERQSYKGFRVASFTPQKVCEIFELRAVLETHAAEAFTERASDAEIAEIEAAFVEIEIAFETDDRARMTRAKQRYYDTLFTGCRNVEIRLALGNVMDRIEFLRGQAIADHDRRKVSMREMARLTRALAARDRIEARAATLSHVGAAREAALDLMSRRPAQKGGQE